LAELEILKHDAFQVFVSRKHPLDEAGVAVADTRYFWNLQLVQHVIGDPMTPRSYGRQQLIRNTFSRHLGPRESAQS
jgi:hypothetical protein